MLPREVLEHRGERVCRMFSWDVLGRDRSECVYELPSEHILGRDRCEQCDRLHELSRRGVFVDGGERVYHVPRRIDFSERELVGGCLCSHGL